MVSTLNRTYIPYINQPTFSIYWIDYDPKAIHPMT